MKKIVIMAAIMMMGTTAFAANASDASSVTIGSSRTAVYDTLGAGESTSSGLKETYELDGGAEAVLHFDNDILVRGFILND